MGQDFLFAEERQAEIIKLVNERGKVLVPELIEHFKMSPATIRNDLRDIESKGYIRRTHGGAIPSNLTKVGYELNKTSKIIKDQEEKRAIAKHAVELVENGDIIILDTGTTTMEMAKLLNGKNNVTVIVNDIEIASILHKFDGIHVVVIGGSMRKSFHCTVGPFAVKLLSELSVDKVFLGTNGFSVNKGCTTPDINQAEIKKAMVTIASQIIVLCDSSKIGKTSFVQFLRPNEINLLITDSRISSNNLNEIMDAGIEVITV